MPHGEVAEEALPKETSFQSSVIYLLDSPSLSWAPGLEKDDKRGT